MRARAQSGVIVWTVVALLLAGCVIQPIQPEGAAPAAGAVAVEQPSAAAPVAVMSLGGMTAEEEAALAVVDAFYKAASSHPLTADNVEEYLAFYSDTAEVLDVGTIDTVDAIQGLPELRRFLTEEISPLKFVLGFDPIFVEGNTVVGQETFSGEPQAASGGPPTTGLQVYVVQDGKIVNDVWTWGVDSILEWMPIMKEIGYDVRPEAGSQAQLGVVEAAMAPAADGLTEADVEETLSHYSEIATFTIYGMPGGTQVYEGKEAIRDLMTGWAAVNERAEFWPLMKNGLKVVGRTSVWDDDLIALGVAPLEGLSTFIVGSDKILEETWTISAESLKNLMSALLAIEASQATPEPAGEAAALAAQEAETLAAHEAYNAYVNQAPLTMQTLDGMMDFFAEDAVFMVVGVPGEFIDIQGRDAIRAYTESSDVQFESEFNFEPIFVHGNQVTAHNLTNSTILEPSGVTPYQGTEVLIYEGGKIVADFYSATPETNQDFARLNGQTVNPKSDNLTVVQSIVAPWTGEGVDEAAIEESLQYYADDARIIFLGLPTGAEIYEGKDAIRKEMANWVGMSLRWDVEPLSTVGDIVVTRSSTWADPTIEMGIAPNIATETWVVKDGLIEQQVWALTPESMLKLKAAMERSEGG